MRELAGAARRDLAASASRFGQADRDRLFAAAHLLAGATRAQRPALHLAHGALDLLARLLPVLAGAAAGGLASRGLASRRLASRRLASRGLASRRLASGRLAGRAGTFAGLLTRFHALRASNIR